MHMEENNFSYIHIAMGFTLALILWEGLGITVDSSFTMSTQQSATVKNIKAYQRKKAQSRKYHYLMHSRLEYSMKFLAIHLRKGTVTMKKAQRRLPKDNQRDRFDYLKAETNQTRTFQSSWGTKPAKKKKEKKGL